MSFLSKIFKKEETPANKAFGRLKTILEIERAEGNLPWLDDMREDILQVVKKYAKVHDVQIRTGQNQNISSIEVEIQLGR